MRVGDAHLTYCTNIHPGESWAEVRRALADHVVAVKAKVAPDRPFGIGLRLSARAARELAAPSEMVALRRFLADHDLYVFTINGFPYGAFHGTRVKEEVYRPDWLDDDRLAYTDLLADLLAALLPAGVTGSISTVPGCFRAVAGGGAGEPRTADAATAMARRIGRAAAHLDDVERRTGRHIVLALEPEPACFVETVAEAIAFCERLPRDRVGICLDACHGAVAYEEPAAALTALAAAGVLVGKVQLSSGLRVAPVDAAAREALAGFADDVYLHQVVARRGDALVRFVDLPDALTDRGAAAADEWRVHFHVPIFRRALGRFTGTQAWLEALLAAHARAPVSSHLEVETYTWDVLPEVFRGEPVDDAIARELTWVLERLGGGAGS
jgi:sugar phosphate isomerase/epimerase